ncbi:hypothetical protein [Chelativorans xinjiangense]|uniref:hypothetical protein n=1 Tax=Chelativorans xinjiangense TaxID=2681485 RepID=UPI00135B3F8E|nr:hypothetical protein [Chelativorans xinjiangense]
MKYLLIIVFSALLSSGAQASNIDSAYTELKPEENCSPFAGGNGEGEHWSDLVCSGYKGYPVLIYYGDARESLFYGFPPSGHLAPAWESFSGFNSAGPSIEWRIVKEGGREIPFATIHRWSVADADDPEKQIEVLVVEKVAQIGTWEGCSVGYVVATGKEDANEEARRIADARARDFECGTDQPTVIAGSVPMPGLTR